jgi:hypothetical protein
MTTRRDAHDQATDGEWPLINSAATNLICLFELLLLLALSCDAAI